MFYTVEINHYEVTVKEKNKIDKFVILKSHSENYDLNLQVIFFHFLGDKLEDLKAAKKKIVSVYCFTLHFCHKSFTD